MHEYYSRSIPQPSAIHSKHGPEVMAVAAKFLYLAPFFGEREPTKLNGGQD